MSDWRPNEDSASDDDEDIEFYNEFDGREAIIFLIDAFLSENPERFQECLDIICKALLNGLLTNEKDLIGIVFYNTKNKPDPKDVDGIKDIVVKENTAVLLPLRQLTKDIVSYFLDFQASDTDHFDFNNKYGCKIGSFANSIWLCTNMFKQCGVKLVNQNIIMFTDREIPPDVEAGDFQKAIRKASDLNAIDVDFNVIPMKDDFSYDRFYKEFICTVQDIELDEFVVPDPKEEREMLSDRHLRQNFKKKCNAHLKWIISDGIEISTSVYNYYRKNVYPKSVKVLSEDNSIVQMKIVYKIKKENAEDDDDDGEERLCRPGDEIKTISVGGQKISFTSDELAKLRSPLTPRLTLLGFKPRSEISIQNFIRSSSFLYPDENVIEGSTKLFRSLWEKCLEKDKIAICVMVSRRKSYPRYVALVPVEAIIDDDNHAIPNAFQKDGFKIVYLPFEIDYRDNDLSDWNEINKDIVNNRQIELFQKITKKLKSQFLPTSFHDPSLEKLRTDIISLALDVEQGDKNENKIVDEEEQDSIIERFVDEMKNLFGEEQEPVMKRKADKPPSAGENQAKISKTNKTGGNDLVSENEISQLNASNKLNQLNVKQLKTYLQSKNVTGISSATKAVLIQKIQNLHS